MKTFSVLSAKAILISIMAITANAAPSAEPQTLATDFGNCKADGAPCNMKNVALKDCCPGMGCWNYDRSGNKLRNARCVGARGFFQCVRRRGECLVKSDCCEPMTCVKAFAFQTGYCN